MRFEELAYRKGGADVCVPLHRKLTVVAGLGMDARRQWIGRVLGALSGTPAGSDVTLVFVDGRGSRIRLARDNSGRGTAIDLETGEDLAEEIGRIGHVDWLAHIGLTLDHARELVVMTPADVRSPSPGANALPSAELIEAREVLAAVEEEYAAAGTSYRRVEELERRLQELVSELSAADEELARRRYARAVAEASRLEAELAALTGADPIDRAGLEAGVAALAAAERWKRAADVLHRATQDFGDRRRLDGKALARVRDIPLEVPRGLQELHEGFLAAERDRAALLETLAEHAASEMAPPSAPFVLALAQCDQKDLWDRAEDVLQTHRRAGGIAIGLGGANDTTTAVAEIEAVHAEVDEAERAVDHAKFGALAVKAKRRLAKAQAREQAVLDRAGFPSYLAFQMRRIDVLIDANARENLQVAGLEHQLATKAWQELAGDVTAEEALAKRSEIERLARHIAAVDSSTDAVDVLQRDLVERVEPAYTRALAALQEACSQFDVNVEHAVSEVAALVFEARTAKLQEVLDAAVLEHDRAYDDLEEALAAAGQPGPGDLESRVAAVQVEVMEAEVRSRDQEAAPSGRNPDEVRTELERARAAASRLSRPGWPARPPAPTGDDPDIAALQQERSDVETEIEVLSQAVPDMPRLTDRRNALRRRVEVLEAGRGQGPQVLDPHELELYVLARFASARRIGPEAEPVPMLVDDALADMARSDKWKMLDLVARLGEATQVVYLTNDDDAIEWAQQRSAEGSIALVEGHETLTSRPR